MSNEIIVLIKEELKVLVKEAVREALEINAKHVADLAEPIKEVEKKDESKKEVKEVKKAKKAEKAKEVKEDVENGAEENDSEVAEDIESLSYNDLKKKCKEMGVSAVGNRATLVARLLEHLEGSESEEETEESNNTKETKKPATGSNKGKKTVHEEEEEDSEDEDEAEEFYEELDESQIKDIVADLGKDDLLAIIEEMGEELPKYTKKKAVDMIVKGGQATVDALVLLGYVDTDEEEDTEVEEGEEEHSLADDLAELETEELAEICSEYELSVKGKKQALIDRIVKAVEDGIIEEDDLFEDEEDEESNVLDAEYEDVEDEDIEDDADEEESDEDWYSEEELEEYETEELEEIANENEIEIPKKKVKKGKKTVTVTDRKALIQAILELGDEEEDEEAEEDADAEGEYEPKQERLDKEEEIEEEIRAKYKAKKLKDADIKKFLVKYNEGNPDFKMSDLSKKEALEQYIEAKVGLVDDDGYVSDPEECYIRNNEYFCCGKQLSMNKGTYYCEVCGNEFKE